MAFTKVVGPGIHTLSNILSHNINSSGIITATKFVGPFDNINVGGATTLTVDGINISAGILTAQTLDLNGNGDISGNLVVGGNLTANGDFTTLNTTLREVELLRVDAQDDNVAAGIITQRGTGNILELYDGSNKEFSVADGGTVYVSQSMAFQQSNRTTTAGLLGRGSLLLAGTQQTDFAIRSAPHDSNLVLGVGVTERLRIKPDGNVGINSSAPTSKLDVEGDVKISGITTTGSYFNAPSGLRVANHPVVTYASFNLGTGSYATRLGSTGTSTLRHTQIYAGGSHMATFDGNNTRLGIGKTNPDELLHIASTGTAKFRLTDNRTSISDGSQYGVIQFEQRDSNTPGVSVEVAALMTDTTNGATALQIKTGTPSTITERLRIDSSGRVILGGTASRDTRSQGSAYSGQLQLESNGEAALTMTRFGGVHPSRLNLQHARGTIDSIAAAQNDDDLGQISFSGWDGDTFTNAAEIRAEVDGAPGDDDMPGRLIFSTTPDGTFDPKERLRIASTGDITIGTAAAAGGKLYFESTSGAAQYIASGGTNNQSLIIGSSAGEFVTIASDGKSTFAKEIKTPQDYPNQKPVIDFNFAAVKKLDPRIKYYRSGPASYVNEFGRVVSVAENEPRFDHDPITRKSKGLLIEQLRVNFLTYSNFIGSYGSGNSWLYGVGTDVFSASSGSQLSTNPDGSSPAYHYAPSSSAGYHRFYGSVTLDQYDTSYVVSVFAKRVTEGSTSGLNRYLEIEVSGNFALNGAPTGHSGSHGMSSVTFDLQGDGAIESQSTTTHGYVGSPKMEKFADGWWRLSYVFNPGTNDGSSSLSGNIWFGHPDSLANDDGSETGNGNPSFYLWGAMIERGGHLTSYIPNHGAYNATRGFDNVVVDGDDFTDFYNPTESTALAVGTVQRPAATQGQLNIFHVGNSNNDGHGVFREHGTKDVFYHIRNNNSTPSGGNLNPSGYGDWDEGEEARIAIAFKDGDQAISVNGGNQVTATVTTNYPTDNITKMWIGSAGGNGSGQFEGTISRIAYYPKQLTDNQLNTLTAS